MKLPMFVDSSGTPSFTMTSAAISLGIVLLKYLAAGITIGKFVFSNPDPTLSLGILGVCFTSYVARRNDILTPNASIAARSQP